MKKTIITLLAALLLPLSTQAQHKLIIRYADGTTFEKNVWDVDSIYFEEIDDMTLPEGAPAPTAVDLGLSVQWANINLGATSPTDAGWLVGWGDVTGLNVSKNLKWYPVAQPTGDIVGFGNDIIKKYWSTETDVWRLPTDEELQELINNCTWEWVDGQDGTGFNVTGTNGNSIFLPAAGSRDGEAVSGVGTALNYWCGTLNKTDNSMAKAMMFTYGNGDKPSVGVLKRYMGCALRAVYGEPKINVSISSGEAYNLGVSSATIKVQLSGSYSNYIGLRVGLVYGTQKDLQNDPNRNETPTQTCSNGFCDIDLTNLTPDVPYWYCAFVEVNGQRIYQQEESKCFATTMFPEPTIVDLGLSVKWASFNVGATSSTESGRYIGWGDPTGTKESRSYDDYGYSVTTKNIGFNQNYDTPYALWGKKWRMPTRAEFEELFDKTTVTFDNNTKCNVFTAANGSSISIPYCGLISQYSTTSTDYKQTKYGWYWTAECNDEKSPYLACLYNNVMPDIQLSTMWYRMPIRAVYEEASSYQGGGSGNGSGDNNGGSGEGGNDNPVVEPTPETPVAGTAVNLGLPSGTKWADRNVGATSQDIVGDYLTWGAIEMQEQYTVASYIYGNSSDLGGMKYLGTYTDMEYQKTHSYSIAGTQYDAAYVRWGSTWHLPTQAQINELIDECTWTWSSRTDTKHGVVYGYEVKGKNGNKIFLAASGRMVQTDDTPQVFKLDEIGYYWSDYVYYGVAEERYNQNAHILQFKEGEYKTTYMERNIGLPIRPVK